MALGRRAKRRIKRVFILATVVITVTLLYWHNVFTHEFAREIPIAKFLKKRKSDTANTSSQVIYQLDTTCLDLSIQSEQRENSDKTYGKCKPWKQTEDDCGAAKQFYSSNKDIYCKVKSKNVSKDICRFVFSNIRKFKTNNKTPHIFCDRQICQGGRLFVGSVNPETGIVTSLDWREFHAAKSAEFALPGIISNNVKNGLSFCLIRCVKNDENIDQLLTFQHLFHHEKMRAQSPINFRVKRKRRRKVRRRKVRRRKVRRRKVRRRKVHRKNRKLFNINLVVLDSVSRHHFYRMMPKTVNTLRHTRKDIRVLDYEFLQSLAPYTYTNIKALFTGTIDKEPHNKLSQTIGINNLYGHFKSQGYHTLFQEDSCWYDHWGTVLENNIRKDKLPQSREEFKKSWEIFKKLTKNYSIDDYGLTHFSCVVFTMHGITNMFNEPLQVCYDGQPFSSYFLRYTRDFLNQPYTRKNKEPTFSYLHSNIGHEVTGLRIKALDEALSIFLKDMANQKDTLTIILSDHGPKTTPYSQDYLRGRYETYDSLLFMIIPKKVQNGLGVSRMAALLKNQKSLVTMKDVHEMLIEMTQLRKRKRMRGLFSQNISNRTCDSIQMVNYGVCKCRDWQRIFIDQSPQFIWLAEFVTEILNNKIREQFSKSNQSGFRKCHDLQLHRIWNIRQRVSNGHHITTFDLVVQPLYNVFLVQTKHIENNDKVVNVKLQSWRRVSIYRHFLKCKDRHVDIELCICGNLHRRNSKKRLLRIIEDGKVSKDKEIINTRSSCLYILLTKAADKLESIFSYDVINICVKRYSFTVENLSYAGNMPGKKIVKKLEPNIDTFLLSVVVKGRKPTLKYFFKQT